MSDTLEKSIDNFEVEVISEVEIVTDTRNIPHVKFVIKFGNGTNSEEITVPLTGAKGLEKLNWFNVHPYLTLNVKLGKAQQYLNNIIRSKLPHVKKEIQYSVNRVGTVLVDNEPMFCTGGGLIRAPSCSQNKIKIVLEPQKLNLAIDHTLSEREAVTSMIKMLNLIPNAGRIIVAQTLLYLMREIYKTVWKSPCCCVFLYGESGTKKTTTAAYLTQLYNRHEGIASLPRLNSSIPAAVNIIYQKNDCVIVLDDLFPADSNKVREQQEETLFEITRIIADGVPPGRVRGYKVALTPPTCGVLFTAEYLIGTGSDAARLLPVKMTLIDSEKFKTFQDRPLIVSTFYYGFIKWYIENFYNIKHSLEKWLDTYSRTKLGVHDRLKEIHFFLNTSYKLFMQYCVEKGFTSNENAKSHHQSFEDLLTVLVQEQEKRVRQGKDKKTDKIDSYKLIRTLYKSDSFCLAKNKKRYDAEPKVYDGLIYNNELLCLRSEPLLNRFQQLGYSNTIYDIRSSLIANNALKLDGEGKNYKIGNTRFYGIYINKLK